MSFGLTGIVGLRRYVGSLDESRSFYVDRLGFAPRGATSERVARALGERSEAYGAGDCTIVCTQPLHPRSLAGGYLQRHPEGIGAVIFGVADPRAAFAELERRGATPVADVHTYEVGRDGPRGTSFAIATPMSDVRFEFVDAEVPWVRDLTPAPPRDGGDRFRFGGFDHITANHQTMAPTVLWARHVLGWQPFWTTELHTAERGEQAGSGLRSVVVWDPSSGVKLANNEPLRPRFEASQIALFCADQRGAGIQHAALEVADIVGTVEALRRAGVRFAEAPPGYHDDLLARMQPGGDASTVERIEQLRGVGVLADGRIPGRHLLQIFMEDAARFAGDPKRSPFFFELIQREGADGFGEGNFYALFQAVARSQRGRVGLASTPADGDESAWAR